MCAVNLSCKLKTDDMETKKFSDDFMTQIMDEAAWRELSANSNIELTFELLDRFADEWDWEQIINHSWHDSIYSQAFMERYKDRIPASKLQDSALWRRIIELRKLQIAQEIMA